MGTEGAVCELGRDFWAGATQLGGWVAVSRFLKFPILGNFAGFGKSRLRPSGRTFPRLVVGGYTRRKERRRKREGASGLSRNRWVLPASLCPSLLHVHMHPGDGKDEQGLPSPGRCFPAGSSRLHAARHLREGCTGQWPAHLPAVTCKGNQVPVHGVLFTRGSLRSAGEST